MADSGALRTRRSRAHKAGDHQYCKRCVVLRAESAATSAGVPPPVGDQAKLRWLAGLLAEDYVADRGNALLARELRMTLQALLDGQGKPSVDGDLADLFAELSST